MNLVDLHSTIFNHIQENDVILTTRRSLYNPIVDTSVIAWMFAKNKWDKQSIEYVKIHCSYGNCLIIALPCPTSAMNLVISNNPLDRFVLVDTNYLLPHKETAQMNNSLAEYYRKVQ